MTDDELVSMEISDSFLLFLLFCVFALIALFIWAGYQLATWIF